MALRSTRGFSFFMLICVIAICLSCCTSGSDAFVGKFLAEVYVHPFNFAYLTKSLWFALAVAYIFIMDVTFLFVHSNAPLQIIVDILSKWGLTIILGGLTSVLAHVLFKFPRLIETAVFHGQTCDKTHNDRIKGVVCAEEMRKDPCKRAKALDVWRVWFTKWQTWFPLALLIFATVVTTVGAYILLGFDKPQLIRSSRTTVVGLPLVLVGGILVLAAFAWLWMSPAPNNPYEYTGRYYVKYLIALVVLSAPPVYYAYEDNLPKWLNGIIMALIIIVVWAAFFFYARFLGRDPYFSSEYWWTYKCTAKHRWWDTFWFCFIGATPGVIVNISVGLANHLFPESTNAAMHAVFIGVAVVWLIFIAVRFLFYEGYKLRPKKCIHG